MVSGKKKDAEPKSKLDPAPEGERLTALESFEILELDLPTGTIKHETLARFRDAILERHYLAVTKTTEGLMRRIECGALLSEARDIIIHNYWTTWLEENFSAETGLSIRTAQRYIRDYRGFLAFLRERMPEGKETTALSPVRARDLVLEYCKLDLGAGGITKTDKTKINTWITPKSVVEVVESVIGQIDCDPCASSSPQAVPLAAKCYTIEEDGLADKHHWVGTAWIAPGHHGDLSPWASKALAEFKAGRLSEAILSLPVTPLNLPTEMQECPIAIGRSPFTVGYPVKESLKTKRLKVPHVFVYMSRTPKVETFAKAFNDIAVVLGKPSSAERNLLANSVPGKQ